MASRRKARRLANVILGASLICSSHPAPARNRIIEIVADHDSRYWLVGQAKSIITAFAGEELLLHITARKASTQNRDGSVHGFTLLRAKERTKVPGWDFLLKPGSQEIPVRVPVEPGEYEVVCTVLCSENHDGMH